MPQWLLITFTDIAVKQIYDKTYGTGGQIFDRNYGELLLSQLLRVNVEKNMVYGSGNWERM